MASECLWNELPGEVTLPEDEVHVWCVSLDQSASHIQSLFHILSPKERTRAERFHFERDHRRYIASQGHLRKLLGRYLRIAPEHIEFCHGARGKPALKETGNTGTTLKFNLSHSHEVALYAITQNREVGIDIEHIRPVSDAIQIAERFFSPQEQKIFRSLPPEQQIEAFFNCWTRKEAFIKAIGEGLYHPLDQFSVSLAPGEPARLLHVENDPQETARWFLQALNPASGYVATLVVEGQSLQLKCWRIQSQE
jgi:4'-phosphopantetheinyl transferase